MLQVSGEVVSIFAYCFMTLRKGEKEKHAQYKQVTRDAAMGTNESQEDNLVSVGRKWKS